MKERPILFSAPMVRAILEGRKTQTRRIVTDQSIVAFRPDGTPGTVQPRCRFGQCGDRLWVRETACIAPKRFAAPDDTCVKDNDGDLRYVSYKADGHSEDAMRDYNLRWTPAIHMPRWAARIWLDITAVRVERLNDISNSDCFAEGLPSETTKGNRTWFSDLWDEINGEGAWDRNPFVWVIEFQMTD